MTQKEYALAQADGERDAARDAGTQDLEATQLVSLDDLKELERLQLAGAAQAEPARKHRRAIVRASVTGLVLAAALLATVLVVHVRQAAQPHATAATQWGRR